MWLLPRDSVGWFWESCLAWLSRSNIPTEQQRRSPSPDGSNVEIGDDGNVEVALQGDSENSAEQPATTPQAWQTIQEKVSGVWNLQIVSNRKANYMAPDVIVFERNKLAIYRGNFKLASGVFNTSHRPDGSFVDVQLEPEPSAEKFFYQPSGFSDGPLDEESDSQPSVSRRSVRQPNNLFPLKFIARIEFQQIDVIEFEFVSALISNFASGHDSVVFDPDGRDD